MQQKTKQVQVHRTQDSLLNYPLYITSRKHGFRWTKKHVKHYESHNTCALNIVTKKEFSVIVFYPKPAWCKLSDERRSIALINHEILHLTLELLAEDNANYSLDDLWSLALLGSATEDCQYCFCELNKEE